MWLRGCDARDAYALMNMVNTLTPGVFQSRFGVHGCFVTFAAEAIDGARLDAVAVEVRGLAATVSDRLPLAEIVIHDDLS